MSDKQPPASNAAVAANVDLKPQGSQTLLVGLIVLAGIAMILGAGLLSIGRNSGWVFVLLSMPLAGIAARGWFAAHADADLNDAKPTTISSTAAGLTVSTDSRTLRSPIAAQAFSQLIEASQRQRLPVADALVENGVPVPGSAATANARVQQINQVVDDQRCNLEALVHSRPDGPAAVQRPTNLAIPPDDISSRLNISSQG